MLNLAQIIGRCGQNPEVRHLESGSVVASFSMATSEKYTDKGTGEAKETTTWHNIVAWGKLAEIVEKYVNKGDLLYIGGKLQTRSWEKDGVTRYTTEIKANTMQMLGGGSGNQNRQQEVVTPEVVTPEVGSDSLPF